MSRSNPTTESQPHPCQRWFEWSASKGHLFYYDKEAKEEKPIGDQFGCILLDQLSAVRGWDDASNSGIVSNEVRDTRQDVLLVRSFKGGEIANGLYAQIKDRVAARGGHYVANIYVAYKHEGALALGCIQLKGAALNTWVEFSRENRADLMKKAFKFGGTTEGKKGSIKFLVPKFSIVDLSPESDAEAKTVDAKLQEYLSATLKKKVEERVVAPVESDETQTPQPEDDLPFNSEEPRPR